MARPSTPRTNYRQEAMAVSRILGALEADTTSNREWLTEVTSHFMTALDLLLRHTPVTIAYGKLANSTRK